MTATATAPRRPSLRLRLLLLAIGLLLALLVVELAFHAAPGLIPGWFRQRFPPHGIEFWHRGLLDRTPLTAVPLPYGVTPYDGPPPSDLVDFGVATVADAAADREAVPRLVVPADADGLPNGVRPERPDLVLVGDSFTVFAAHEVPRGLQSRLAQELRVSALNLGISGIGPDHELWLLEHVGLPAKPRLVVWFFFAGNDVLDAFWMQHNLSLGMRTFGDLFADRRAPALILPSLLRELLVPASPRATPLPGLALANSGRRLWFYPDTLMAMSLPADLMAANAGWQGTTTVLRAARERCRQHGAQLLVVYLPSKEQICLPLLEPNPALLRRFAAAATFPGITVPDDADALWSTILANRGVIEAQLHAFCAAEGIALWSATPSLEAAARAGEPVFYATDSHWRPEGQAAVAPGLIERIRQTGLFPK